MRDFSKCPRCGSQTKPSIAFNNAESEFWVSCTKCNTYINTYIPQDHQETVHRDTHRYVGNFGGYGSGKTTNSREEVYKHFFLTPKGNTLIGANIAPQYEQTLKRDIEADLPKAFFRDWSSQKQWYDLENDHRIMYRPLDDEGKLRSYNLTMFVVLEASEVKEEIFTQLKTRLRNRAATIPETDEHGNIIFDTLKSGVQIPRIKYDWRKGIVESNPDPSWIRTDVLLVSSQIYKHGDVTDTYVQIADELDPAISSHVTATSANKFLPPAFIKETCKNKPAWWIARYINSSFLYSEGLVYPGAMNCLVDDFDIPPQWKRLMAYDYGLTDDSVFLYGAIDTREGILYIYREARTKDRNVEELAKLFFSTSKDIPVGSWYTAPIIDPKSGPKRDYDKKTLSDHFLDYGIAFQPGYINLDARIYRLNTYIESGKLRIFKSCTGLASELRNYKFVNRSAMGGGWSDKPEDKNNHGINPLEWIVMALPADPKNLLYGIYDKEGRNLIEPPKTDQERYNDFVFSDEETREESDWNMF